MKKILSLVMVLLMFALPAMAEGTQAATLTVSGGATVTIDPDYAQVIVGVTISALSVDQASADNATAIAAVQEALKAIGIAEEDIATYSFNVSPTYDYSDYSGTPKTTGYQVEHMLKVTVRDLNQLGIVLDEAIKAGANQTYGVTFLSTKQGDAADTALQNAIAQAIRKAEIAAKAAGKELGSLISIEEDNYGYTPVYGAYEKMAADTASGTNIIAGSLEVSAAVKVTFELK